MKISAYNWIHFTGKTKSFRTRKRKKKVKQLKKHVNKYKQRIAENWDELPEYARGKIDGTISMVAALCTSNDKTKAAG